MANQCRWNLGVTNHARLHRRATKSLRTTMPPCHSNGPVIRAARELSLRRPTTKTAHRAIGKTTARKITTEAHQNSGLAHRERIVSLNRMTTWPRTLRDGLTRHRLERMRFRTTSSRSATFNRPIAFLWWKTLNRRLLQPRFLALTFHRNNRRQQMPC